ncbi:MAG: hypothetical protein Q8M07_13425 [Prosthecobacter sp.]|nr:hypothetical protein [Prosthecobacter sp.]
MKAASEQEFPARKGPEGNEAGLQGSGEHTHPAGNPIKSRYFFFRAPRWIVRLVVAAAVVSTLGQVAALCISQIKAIADWATVISSVPLIVMLMLTDIQEPCVCQTGDDEEGEV